MKRGVLQGKIWWRFTGGLCPKCSGRLVENQNGIECGGRECDYKLVPESLIPKTAAKDSHPRCKSDTLGWGY